MPVFQPRGASPFDPGLFGELSKAMPQIANMIFQAGQTQQRHALMREQLAQQKEIADRTAANQEAQTEIMAKRNAMFGADMDMRHGMMRSAHDKSILTDYVNEDGTPLTPDQLMTSDPDTGLTAIPEGARLTTEAEKNLQALKTTYGWDDEMVAMYQKFGGEALIAQAKLSPLVTESEIYRNLAPWLQAQAAMTAAKAEGTELDPRLLTPMMKILTNRQAQAQKLANWGYGQENFDIANGTNMTGFLEMGDDFQYKIRIPTGTSGATKRVDIGGAEFISQNAPPNKDWFKNLNYGEIIQSIAMDHAGMATPISTQRVMENVKQRITDMYIADHADWVTEGLGKVAEKYSLSPDQVEEFRNVITTQMHKDVDQVLRASKMDSFTEKLPEDDTIPRRVSILEELTRTAQSVGEGMTIDRSLTGALGPVANRHLDRWSPEGIRAFYPESARQDESIRDEVTTESEEAGATMLDAFGDKLSKTAEQLEAELAAQEAEINELAFDYE